MHTLPLDMPQATRRPEETGCGQAAGRAPRQMAFAELALEAAGLGGWELDVETGHLTWTATTFAIHDLDPGESPSLAAATAFYHPDARPAIESAFQAAIDHGTAWQKELPLITAKGRPILVRICGCAIRADGRTARLTGTLQDVTERRALDDQAARLAVVAHQMTNAVIITDTKGNTEWINDAFVRLTSYTLEEMRGRPPGAILQGPETDPATRRHIHDCLARGVGFEVEIVNYTRDHAPYWIGITCTPLRDEAGNPSGFIAVESDVTARRHAETELRREAEERKRAEKLLRDVLDVLPSAVIAYDQAERIILTNAAFADMFPIAASFAAPGRSLEDLVRYGVANGQYPEAGDTEAEREHWTSRHLSAHRSPGRARTLGLPNGRFVQARERRSDSGILVCIRSDTTELKRAEAELRTQAERDSMTGLSNRMAFLAALDRTLYPPSGNPIGGTLVLFDVDRFKSINDTFGHDVGDALLVDMAARLRESTRGSDMAARLGGDEFVILMPGLIDRAVITRRIDALHAKLNAEMALGDEILGITTSMGITLFPQDGTTPERLLKTADLALYQAKRTGRARWCFFEPAQAEAMGQPAMAGRYRNALAAEPSSS